MKKTRFIFLILVFCLRVGAFQKYFDFSSGDIGIVSKADSLEVHLKGGVPLISPGMPELPFIPEVFSIPEGSDIERVEAVPLVVETLRVGKKIKTIPPEWALAYPTKKPRKKAIPIPYPRNQVISFTSGGLFGQRVGEVALAPIQYDIEKEAIIFTKRLKLEIYLKSAPLALTPSRRSYEARKVASQFLKRVIKDAKLNFEDNIQPQKSFMPTELPSLDGSPVAMVIITSDDLLEPFTPLALLRTREGIPTVLKTTSWIEQNYPGADLAEKIRNFLRDAYLFWGTTWVILGGDPDIVPKKTLYDYLPPNDSFYFYIPSDRYYAELESEWDKNGNGKLGEFADSVDLFPDLFVARIPVRTPGEVENFLNKLEIYERNPIDRAFFKRALFTGASIFVEGDGGRLCDTIAALFPDSFDIGRIYESESYNPTVGEFMDSVKSGYGIIYTQAHGSFDVLSISFIGAHHYLTNNQAMELENYDTPSFVYISSCDTGGDDKECIEEHFFRSQGGAFAALSLSRLNFPYVQISFDKLFFDSLFGGEDQRIGVLLVNSQIPLIPLAAINSYYRYQLFGQNLEGDPSTCLWNWPPRPIEIEVDSIHLGFDTVRVSVFDTLGISVSGIDVTLWKEGEVFESGLTDSEGEVHLPVTLESPGSLSVVAKSNLYLPREIYVPVEAEGSYPRLAGYTIDDSLGDGDGIPEPRETLSITFSIENTGEGLIRAGWLRFVSIDKKSCVLVARSDFEAIPQGEIRDIGPFLVYLKDNLSDRELLRFTLNFYKKVPILPTSGPSKERGHVLAFGRPPLERREPMKAYASDTLIFPVRAPILEHVGNTLSGLDTFCLRLQLLNSGGGDARGITAMLSSDEAEITDSLIYLGSLGPGEFFSDTLSPAFKFFLDSVPLDSVRFFLTLQSDLTSSIETLRLREVLPPESVWVYPLWQGARVLWSPSADPKKKGYRVYRDSLPDEPKVLLTPQPIFSLLLEDNEVNPGDSQYYWVSTIDSFGNESQLIGPLKGFSNPLKLPGWPVWVPEFSFSTPLVLDLVPDSPGLEVATCTRDGFVYLFSSQGELLPGWPVDMGDYNNFYGSPAAGDIDGDGMEEFVVAPRGPINEVFAFETDGSYVEGWPRSIEGGSSESTAGVFGSPVIANLDLIGTPEIIVKTMEGKIYAWHGDGSGLTDSTGLLFDLEEGSWGESQLSVGDINCDGIPEVIAGTKQGELYVISPEGEVLPDFPVEGLGHIFGSIAVGDIEPDSLGLEMAFVGGNSLYVVDATGDILPGWPKQDIGLSDGFKNNPSLADLNGDGHPEILLNGEGGIYAYYKDGTPVENFPFVTHGEGSGSSVTVGRIDDEIFLLAGNSYGETRCYDASGDQFSGFPIYLVETPDATPMVADLNLDGKAEVITGSEADRLWVFCLDASSGDMEWPTFKHDFQRTGNYENREVLGKKEVRLTRTLKITGPLPNPFSSRSTIFLNLPERMPVEMLLFDVSGRRVANVMRKERLSSGFHKITLIPFDLHNRPLPSGVYFLKIRAGEKRFIKKVVDLH